MQNYTLITGATSGIGSEVSKLLAAKTHLVLHGRDMTKLKTLQKELNATHLIWGQDLEQTSEIKDSLSQFIKEKSIVIDKVVHCAGVDNTLLAKGLETSVLEKTMKINFYSIVEIINVLLKYSINSGALKNILFISSISAVRGFKAKGAYSSSKAALDAYMRVLSKELKGVAVNSILPGAVLTDMTTDVFSDPTAVGHFTSNSPLGIGSALKVAQLIDFYSSNNDLWVTGQQIIVDGGYL